MGPQLRSLHNLFQRWTINVYGRAHHGLVCGFLVFWIYIAIETFVLLHHSIFEYSYEFHGDVSQMR